ncbi:hypothetical protein Bhyg_07595 [Pseudolycoriella hygida]|uniref:Uncharacterized protein n=1 Tax=Pseudolycoriella hygida TaxID=35572 RepID=A0A9Q0S253_9DIPT|nr:hypothetical protein Bhyg_07595 [Pseudolycoriella hygida]
MDAIAQMFANIASSAQKAASDFAKSSQSKMAQNNNPKNHGNRQIQKNKNIAKKQEAPSQTAFEGNAQPFGQVFVQTPVQTLDQTVGQPFEEALRGSIGNVENKNAGIYTEIMLD